jgi:nicotinamide-nucleotide amidase
MDTELEKLSAEVGAALQNAGLLLATAESCTGGWVAQVVTHTAGSSEWFDRGFITYSNDAKRRQLKVGARTLVRYGAVSPETAVEMAAGALEESRALISLAITGIAGPGGGSPDKPVGTVCFAWCQRGHDAVSRTRQFDGDREAVRRQSVIFALEHLLDLVGARTVP